MALPLKKYAGGFKPSSGNDLEKLPTGDYEFECGSAEKKDLDNDEGCIISLPLTVLGGPLDGTRVTQKWWLNSQDKVNMFGADLKKFGFDTENWTEENERPLEVEGERALKCMPGLKIKCSKVEKKGQGEVFHNLRFHGRV